MVCAAAVQPATTEAASETPAGVGIKFSFRPSITIVVGIFTMIFSLTFLLLIEDYDVCARSCVVGCDVNVNLGLPFPYTMGGCLASPPRSPTTSKDEGEMSPVPRCVAFQSQPNGYYLRCARDGKGGGANNSRSLRLDGMDRSREHDGLVHIRCCYDNKYWVAQRRPHDVGWVVGTADEAEEDLTKPTCTLFRLTKGNRPGSIRLLHVHLRKYACLPSSSDTMTKLSLLKGDEDVNNATTYTVHDLWPQMVLWLEEAVVSREIYNVVFDLSEPRIYGRSVVTVATASALNGTTSNNTVKLTLPRTDTEKRTWGSSVTLKLHVATTVCAGVPVIVAGGNVEVSAEFNGSYSWGSPVEKQTTQKVAYEVTVPPKTRVTVASTATRAYCDVPFSYTQRDTLADGRQFTYDMDDGLYTGVNCYDFKYVTSQENI